MVRPIVDEVAALAQALEIAKPVITRIMIEVRRSQEDTGLPYPCSLLEVGPPRRSAASIAPGVPSGVEPTSVRQTANCRAVWPPAPLANAVGALEPHAATDLWPVDWIVPSHLRLDRHPHPHWHYQCRSAFPVRDRRSLVQCQADGRSPPAQAFPAGAGE